MQSINEIRRHIAAVEQTKKITGAMQLVSSTRMKRVMSHIEYNHRYFDRVQEVMKEILLSSESIHHNYIDHRHCEHCTYIIVSGDKGLCGSYNSSVLDFAYETVMSQPKHSIITIGNTAHDYFVANGVTPDIRYFGIAQDPTLTRARQLARNVISMYDDGITDAIRIIYTSFYGETKNKPVMRRLLPIRLTDFGDVTHAAKLTDIIYDPSPQAVFDRLVPQYLVGMLFGVLVQAYTSEHFARMNAMQSATTNADEMLKTLKIRYNMARQAAITQEIAEITGAAEALRGEETDEL